MRRTILALVLALAMLVGISLPVFAGGGADAEVQVSDITFTGESYVGSLITASGTVTIISTASSLPNNWQWGIAYAESGASFTATNPDGVVVDSGSASDSDLGIAVNPPGPANFPAYVDASLTYSWSTTIIPTTDGTWVFTHNGTADAWWITVFGFVPTGGGSDSDSASQTARLNVTYRINEMNIYVDLARPTLVNDDGLIWKSYLYNGYYKVVMEPDTIISPADTQGFTLQFHGGKLVAVGSEQCNLKFSKPVSVYHLVQTPEMEQAEWILVATFDEVVAGVPQ